MKILIISHHFYPENNPRAFRATELANEFAKQGHDVKIITRYNEEFHPELVKKYGYEIKDIGKIMFRQINVNGNRTNFYIKSILRRILLLLFEYPNIELMFKTNKALKNEAGYDLIISNAVPYPIHWGVALARNANHKIGRVWIADCGDPYMGCKTDSFKKMYYFAFLEKWFCRKADFISVPNQDHIGQYYKEFRQKIKIIPQGFRFEESKLATIEHKNEVPTFAFAGVLLKQTRNPEAILDYLSTINNDFKFIIYSNSDELIKPYQSKLKNKLEIRNYISRNELLFELSKMDFLLNIEFHESVNSNSPSKLIDYVIVNKPILSLNMLHPDKEKINMFLNGDYSQQLVIANIDKYRIENVVAEFLKLV